MGENGDPLRIAMISYYLPTGSKIGVGDQVDALARAMIERGHHVDVISECPPSSDAPYRTVQLKLTGSLRTFRFATELRKIDFAGYDVIHAHGDDYWLWKRRAGAHIRTLHGSNLSEALHIRGVKERTRMCLLGLSEVLASVVADSAVVVSPGTRRWTPWVRRVIPNGVDLRHFRPDAAARVNYPVILFVGTWGGRKRGGELAAAFAREVRPRLADAELWMVTRDAPPDLPAGVRVLGRVSDERLRELYRQAWVFCLPSSYEGFGIPYIEAMASGTPVVATPKVGSRYVLEEGSGVLEKLDQLGPCLAALLDDLPRRQALAAAGLNRARSFSLESVTTQYQTLYREIIQHKGAQIK